LAVVVTVAKGYDLGYIWKTQGEVAACRTTGGYYKLEPLRSAEPVPASATEGEQLHATPDHQVGETPGWIRDLTTQHQAFRANLDERLGLLDPDRADHTGAFPAWQTPWPDAILQPPKPQIIPSPRIPERAAEYDAEPEAAD